MSLCRVHVTPLPCPLCDQHNRGPITFVQSGPFPSQSSLPEVLNERWNEAVDAAAAIADQEWVGENSLIGSRVARKIADAIRDLKIASSSNATQHRSMEGT